MKRILGLSLAAVMAGMTATADAAPRDDWRGDRGRHGHYQHQRDHGRHGGYDSRRYDDRRHGGYAKHGWHGGGHGYHHDRYDRYAYRPNHGGRHHHRYRAPSHYVRPYGYRDYRWASGHYLPRHYYGPSYYVDYRPYRLTQPPYGHHWVRVGSDVLLVALATGLVVDTMYDLFY